MFHLHTKLTAGTGNDSATFYDRAGNDTYIGTPTSGAMSGTGYSFSATSFDVVKAMFNAGGFDQAFLYGSIGDDHYEAMSTSAFLQGPDFRHEATGFKTVVGVGGAGNDLAERQVSQPLTAIESNTEASLTWLRHSPPNIDEVSHLVHQDQYGKSQPELKSVKRPV